MNKNDEFYMKKALELAGAASGHTSPNPLVGCVIVKNGKIIAEGYHKRAGMPHAEAEALKIAGSRAKGASLYVNLEPCSHTDKRTPPCADAIIKAGIREVVAAMKDPNPKVSGRGFLKLKAGNIKLKVGILERQAAELNRFFVKNMTEKMPYIIIKAGMSLDGKIGLKDRGQVWITSKKSRLHAQQLRKECDAILVGINTVLKDDPFLDCRIDRSKRIKKVILDSEGKTPLNAGIFSKSRPEEIYIVGSRIPVKRIKAFEKKGVNVIMLKGKNRRFSLKKCMRELFKRGIMSVLVEGGAMTAMSFLREKLADEAHFYIAPVIIGEKGLPYFPEGVKKNFDLINPDITRITPDILIKGRIKYV